MFRVTLTNNDGTSYSFPTTGVTLVMDEVRQMANDSKSLKTIRIEEYIPRKEKT